MNRHIKLHNRIVNYSIRRSKKAKRIRLAVYCDGNFVVTVPNLFPSKLIDRYIIAKSQWIITKIDFFEKLNKKTKIKFDLNNYEYYKNKAFVLVENKIIDLNKMNFEFNKLVIKQQKTRWGSCSKKRNLNFNFKIIFLPTKLQEYIIIHELCHLKEFNHSAKYWKTVEKLMPNYVEINQELKINGLSIL